MALFGGVIGFFCLNVLNGMSRRHAEGRLEGIKTGRCIELCLPADIEEEVRAGCICAGTNELKRLRPVKGKP